MPPEDNNAPENGVEAQEGSNGAAEGDVKEMLQALMSDFSSFKKKINGENRRHRETLERLTSASPAQEQPTSSTPKSEDPGSALANMLFREKLESAGFKDERLDAMMSAVKRMSPDEAMGFIKTVGAPAAQPTQPQSTQGVQDDSGPGRTGKPGSSPPVPPVSSPAELFALPKAKRDAAIKAMSKEQLEKFFG